MLVIVKITTTKVNKAKYCTEKGTMGGNQASYVFVLNPPLNI